MAERIFEPHIAGLITKIKEIAKSPLGSDGEHATSADWDRDFKDGDDLSGNTFFAPDASGFANAGVSVDYNGQRVFECDQVDVKVRTYVPGEWERRIDSLYKRIGKVKA